jgi:hypothetical protein
MSPMNEAEKLIFLTLQEKVVSLEGDNNRLREAMAQMRSARVTHFCAGCEVLTRDNDRLRGALNVAIQGLIDIARATRST